jgi:energy-coupling factor transporter ATP-binding protein EcfA2
MMCIMATVVNASVSIAFNEPDILGAELCLGLLQHFWEMLEGGEGRTTGALETMGLGHLAQEQAVVLSMGQACLFLHS